MSKKNYVLEILKGLSDFRAPAPLFIQQIESWVIHSDKTFDGLTKIFMDVTAKIKKSKKRDDMLINIQKLKKQESAEQKAELNI